MTSESPEVKAAVDRELRLQNIERDIAEIRSIAERTLEQATKTNGTVVDLKDWRVGHVEGHKSLGAMVGQHEEDLAPRSGRVYELEGRVDAMEISVHDRRIRADERARWLKCVIAVDGFLVKRGPQIVVGAGLVYALLQK